MAFKQTHSTIPDDIIYHIECDGAVYIGQSKDGFNRIQTHCTEPFRHDYSDSRDGADKIYVRMRESGLYQTKIIYYVGPDYGLTSYDYYWFFSQFIPQHENAKTWTPDKATPAQKRDAAEILHILHEKLNGTNELVNTSMGGQGGSYRYRADKEYIKLLTRTMTPEDALKVINASDTSKKNIIAMVNRVNKYLFTEEWKTVYSQIATADIEWTNTKVEKKYADLTWSDFVKTIIAPLLPTTIAEIFKGSLTDKNTEMYKAVQSFMLTKEAYLKYFLLQAELGGIELTKAEQNLIANNNSHLFTATLNLEPMVLYLVELIRNNIINVFKQGNYSASAVTDKNQKFSGAIRITGLFDVSSLHMRGNNTDYIEQMHFNDRHTVGKRIKVGFSLSNFQYIYARTPKFNLGLVPQKYIEWEVEDDPNMIAIHTTPATDRDTPGYWMSSRNVPTGVRLTDNLRSEFLSREDTWISGVWDTYIRDMLHFWRQYNAADSTLTWHMVSNGRDVWLTEENGQGRRIYFTDVYGDTIAAQLLDNVKYY